MVTQTALRAGLYARISDASELVNKAGNQLAELRELAAEHGYTVVDEFIDDDISAFEGKNARPEFVRMLAAIQDGRLDVVMATEPQRFTRGSATELDALQVACTRAKAVIHTRAAGVQDPGTPMIQAVMRIQDTMAWLEVATIRERQNARYRADRAAGLPSKGLRAVGWEPDNMTIRESEAQHIREVCRMVLEDGATVWAVAQYFNSVGLRTDSMGKERQVRGAAKGVTKPANTAWTTPTARQVLIRPRNAGLIDGKPSQIQQIITPEQLEQVTLAVKGSAQPGPRTQSLLGGILRCQCGETMVATTSYSQRKGGPRNVYRLYRCRMTGFDKTHKHPTMQIHIADERVLQIGFLIMQDMDLNAFDGGALELNAARVELAELRRQRTVHQDMATWPGADLIDLRAKVTQLGSAIDAVEARVVQLESRSSVAAVRDFITALQYSGDLRDPQTWVRKQAEFEDFRALFDGLPIETRRTIIRATVEAELRSGTDVRRLNVMPSGRTLSE